MADGERMAVPPLPALSESSELNGCRYMTTPIQHCWAVLLSWLCEAAGVEGRGMMETTAEPLHLLRPALYFSH